MACGSNSLTNGAGNSFGETGNFSKGTGSFIATNSGG
jgi:hypothetical protein